MSLLQCISRSVPQLWHHTVDVSAAASGSLAASLPIWPVLDDVCLEPLAAAALPAGGRRSGAVLPKERKGDGSCHIDSTIDTGSRSGQSSRVQAWELNPQPSGCEEVLLANIAAQSGSVQPVSTAVCQG